MKVRTDFVTNSSSSSFIFTKKFSDEEINHLRGQFYENLRKEACVRRREALAFEFEWLLEKIKPIDAHDHDKKVEVISWYEEEILSNILKETDANADKTLTDEQVRRLAGLWYLQSIYLGDEEYTPPTYEQIADCLLDCIATDYDHPLYEWITENTELFLKSLIAVAEMPLREIFRLGLGGEYMCYDDIECDYVIEDTFLADKNCIRGCSHMG